MDGSLLVGIGTAIATVGLIAIANRHDIRKLKKRLFGDDETQVQGITEQTDSMDQKLERIETKLDREATERQHHHEAVEEEIRITRKLVIQATTNVAEAVNDDLDDADIDVEDVEPDWYEFIRDEEDAVFDGGVPRPDDD